MQSMFEPVKIIWNGRDYKIAPDAMMEAIARVEEHVTLEEINTAINGGGIKRVNLARAFASLLRYAGGNFTDEEIYKAMFAANEGNAIIASVTTLLAMMVPPSLRVKLEKEGGAEKQENRASRRAARSSSGQRIKRPSPDGESPLKPSGE